MLGYCFLLFGLILDFSLFVILWVLYLCLARSIKFSCRNLIWAMLNMSGFSTSTCCGYNQTSKSWPPPFLLSRPPFQLGLVKLYGLSSVRSFLYQHMGSVECLDDYCIVRFNGLNLFEYSLPRNCDMSSDTVLQWLFINICWNRSKTTIALQIFSKHNC